MHVQKEMLSTQLTHLLTVVQAQQKINHVDDVFENKPKHMINVLFFVCFNLLYRHPQCCEHPLHHSKHSIFLVVKNISYVSSVVLF